MIFNGIIFQLSALINFFFSTYLLWVLVFFGYYSIATDGFLILSLVSIITYGLSANIRNIYLGSISFFNLKKIIQFRIIISILFFILSILIILINTEKYIFHFSLIFIIIVNWNLELVLARMEKNNILLKFFVFSQFLLLIIIPITIYYLSIIFVSLFIFIYCLVIAYYISKNYLKNFSFSFFNYNFFFSLGVSSTLFKYIANFAWRLFAIILVGETKASILFIGFSLGSLFVTIFDVSYGALWLKKIKYKKIFINSFYLFYVMGCMIILYFFRSFSDMSKIEYSLFQSTAILSILGGFFLLKAMHKRQIIYEINSIRNLCYKLDILGYAFNFSIIPILYFVNINYLSMTYLISSIFFYIVYSKYYNYVFNKKKY